MKHIFKIILMLILSINISFSTEPINIKKDITSKLKILGGGCLAPTSQSYLDIGNVRAMILGGGDMWWNLSAAQYEVPKDSDLHSIFAGALWIGGLDDNDNLKVAAMTYRSAGVDFFPGPLNADINSNEYGTVNSDICNEYDNHWSIKLSDVEAFAEYNDCVNNPNCDENQNNCLSHHFYLACNPLIQN